MLELQPASAAHGLVALSGDPKNLSVMSLAPASAINGAVPFETLGGLDLLPVEGQVFRKTPLTPDQTAAMNAERGGVPVPAQAHGRGSRGRLLDLERLLGTASVRGYLVVIPELLLQGLGGLLQGHGFFNRHGRHADLLGDGTC